MINSISSCTLYDYLEMCIRDSFNVDKRHIITDITIQQFYTIVKQINIKNYSMFIWKCSQIVFNFIDNTFIIDVYKRQALYSVEFVTPICNYNDIETIQELVRKLRGAGARVNSSCKALDNASLAGLPNTKSPV